MGEPAAHLSQPLGYASSGLAGAAQSLPVADSPAEVSSSAASAIKRISGRLQIGVLLIVLATLPYANALSSGFTFDDEFQILTNPAVIGGIDGWTILSTPLLRTVYRPFTTFTFALNQQLTPGNAVVFHAVNLGLHAAVTLLVAWLAQCLFHDRRLAILAAAIFAVHPVHTEAVTSLVGRAEVLAALFGLLALLGVVCADASSSSPKRRAWWALSLIAFSLALTSKESALTVLPLIFLLRIALRGESWWRGAVSEMRRLDWVPFVLCVAAYMLLRSLVVEDAPTSPLDNVLVTMPASVRVASAFGVLWDNAAQLLAPLVLSADYSHPQVPVVTSWLAPRCLGGVALLLAALVAAAVSRAAVGFAVLFPFVALALTANFFFPIGTIRGERLLYLPSVGWTLIVAVAVLSAARRWPRSNLLLVAACVWMAALAGRTWVRNADWRDDLTLHRRTVYDAPFSAKARLNYGIALQRDGRYAAALVQFHRSLELYPQEQGAANGVGRALEQLGRTAEAPRWYATALAIDRSYLPAYVNLCRLRLANQEYAAAEAACRAGLRLNPTDANLLKGLGASLLGAGDLQKGRAVLRRAAVWSPTDPELRGAIFGGQTP